MCAQRRKISLGFTPEEFYEGEHFCFIYHDDKEQLATMAKFFISGLEAGERILYATDTPEAFMDAMVRYGLDIGNVDHDFSLAEPYPTFFPEGQFTASHFFDQLTNFYDTAVNEGYTGVRGGAEMTWVSAEGPAVMQKVIEIEARRNQLRNYPVSTCCVYDARKFDGATIMDVLYTHPMMIVRGQLLRNPYYIEPETFLKQLKARSEGNA